jgi:hypothetical protein
MFQLPNSGPIKARFFQHSANTGVVQAHYENCDGAFCYVVYSVCGTDLILTKVDRHPRATDEEAQKGGDAIDMLFANKAAWLGVTRLLMIAPGTDKCIEVRTYETNPTMLAQGYNTASRTSYIN